jgi:pimeloyl-ACP methyl ester carboxylesterase
VRPRLPVLIGCSVALFLGVAGVRATAPVEARPLSTDRFHCPAELGSGPEPVVVLLHGTGSSVRNAWSWSYQRALTTQGFDVCSVELVDRGAGDIQESAARVAGAVESLVAARHRVTLVGHSQGGLVARTVLHWWPELRTHVDDLVMLGTPNQGIPMAELVCAERCVPAYQQMRVDSRFLRALNTSRHEFGAISVTSVAAADDVLVPPDRAWVGSAANLVVQDFCSGRAVGHSGLVGDAAAFAIALDAITHTGPARRARVAVDCTRHRALGMVEPPPPLGPMPETPMTAVEPAIVLGR